MRLLIHHLPLPLLLLLTSTLTNGLVTLKTIRRLTTTTAALRDEINALTASAPIERDWEMDRMWRGEVEVENERMKMGSGKPLAAGSASPGSSGSMDRDREHGHGHEVELKKRAMEEVLGDGGMGGLWDGEGGQRGRGVGGQGLGVGAGEEGDPREEVELTVTAALRTLCSTLILELEKPMPAELHDKNTLPCPKITSEYHAFMSETVSFLHEIQELQMSYGWKGGDESPSGRGVFDGLSWLQGLWASRGSNSQNRSFIEQRKFLYDWTGCFEKNAVLRRDVEVVEYLNDLIDGF